MAREAQVVVTLREDDARWLRRHLSIFLEHKAARTIFSEIEHALAECECGATDPK